MPHYSSKQNWKQCNAIALTRAVLKFVALYFLNLTNINIFETGSRPKLPQKLTHSLENDKKLHLTGQKLSF